MLVRWIPETTNTLPANASHRVGIGAFVMNEKGEVLVVQEKSGKFQGSGVWKFPTGVVDEGEDICDAAVREVKEETGIDTKFVEILAFRQSHKSFFDKSDLFFMCMLEPVSFNIQKQEREIEAAEWMAFEEYAAQEFVQKHDLLKYMAKICIAKREEKYSGFSALDMIVRDLFMEELFTHDELRREAGYGDEKLSNVVVTGSVLCDVCLDGTSLRQSHPIPEWVIYLLRMATHGVTSIVLDVGRHVGRYGLFTEWMKCLSERTLHTLSGEYILFKSLRHMNSRLPAVMGGGGREAGRRCSLRQRQLAVPSVGIGRWQMSHLQKSHCNVGGGKGVGVWSEVRRGATRGHGLLPLPPSSRDEMSLSDRRTNALVAQNAFVRVSEESSLPDLVTHISFLLRIAYSQRSGQSGRYLMPLKRVVAAKIVVTWMVRWGGTKSTMKLG
ncbi:NUDIX hydrolase 2-like protein [Tanacetum coccineum]